MASTQASCHRATIGSRPGPMLTELALIRPNQWSSSDRASCGQCSVAPCPRSSGFGGSLRTRPPISRQETSSLQERLLDFILFAEATKWRSSSMTKSARSARSCECRRLVLKSATSTTPRVSPSAKSFRTRRKTARWPSWRRRLPIAPQMAGHDFDALAALKRYRVS